MCEPACRVCGRGEGGGRRARARARARGGSYQGGQWLLLLPSPLLSWLFVMTTWFKCEVGLLKMGRKEGCRQRRARARGRRQLKDVCAGMVCKTQRIIVVDRIGSVAGREDKKLPDEIVQCDAMRCVVEFPRWSIMLRAADSELAFSHPVSSYHNFLQSAAQGAPGPAPSSLLPQACDSHCNYYLIPSTVSSTWLLSACQPTAVSQPPPPQMLRSAPSSLCVAGIFARPLKLDCSSS